MCGNSSATGFPYLVGARLEVVVAMDWTSFAPRSARHGGVVDVVTRSWTCDAADVEDGEVVDAEGADEAL